MAQPSLSLEQFLAEVAPADRAFVKQIHRNLEKRSCSAAFKQQKTSLLASYKDRVTKRALVNVLLKKDGLFVRVYGDNASSYEGFLNTLPASMIHTIERAHDCKNLLGGGCSPSCRGYDLTIGTTRLQKCRYSGFLFLVTSESKPFLAALIEHEIDARTMGAV